MIWTDDFGWFRNSRNHPSVAKVMVRNIPSCSLEEEWRIRSTENKKISTPVCFTDICVFVVEEMIFHGDFFQQDDGIVLDGSI